MGWAREGGGGRLGRAWSSGSAASTAPRSSATRSWPPPRAPRSAAPSSPWDTRDTEVHVVLSVRDLVRQIPAEWQENVKHRRTLRYGRFLELIRDPERAGRLATWFWGVQEIPDILARWGGELDPSRVHVVTVPPPGAPPTLLWERFADTFGLTGIPLDLQAERVNPSLGVPETALLRQINRTSNKRRRAGALPPAGARAARPPDAGPSHRQPSPLAAAGRPDVGRRAGQGVGRRAPRARLRRRRRPRGAAPGTDDDAVRRSRPPQPPTGQRCGVGGDPGTAGRGRAAAR